MARKPTSTAKATPLPKNLVAGVTVGTPSSGLTQGIQLTDRRTFYTQQSLADAVRSAASDMDALRILERQSGDVGNALSAMIRLAHTKLTFTAFDSLHQVSPQGQAILQSLMVKMFEMADYTDGYNQAQGFDSVIQTMLKEVPLTGATAAELVLDKLRLPSYIYTVSPSTVFWKNSNKKINASSNPKTAYKIIPYQRVLGEPVELDIPTFFYASLDQDPTTPFSTPFFQAAINTMTRNEAMMEDIMRVVRQTGHSRLYLKLIFEKIKAAMPQDIKSDASKWDAWLEGQRTNVEQIIRNLKPEEGFAMWDCVEAGYINSEVGASADYSPLLETLDGQAASCLKTPPAVLAKRMSAGSQNTSSTEALLFLKTAEAIQIPVKIVLSRMFTLALRLFGFEGYVKAEFEKPSIRPDIELAAFRSMDLTTALTLLSLGFITDDECAALLRTGPRAPAAPKLSGTMFMQSNGGSALTDPTSNADPTKRAVTGNLPADTPSRAAK
jgi:hypothetical protein